MRERESFILSNRSMRLKAYQIQEHYAAVCNTVR